MLKIIKKPKLTNPFPDIPDPLGYGQRAVDFLRSLKHPSSTQPDNQFPLDPWQEKIIRQIYSPRYPDGRRIVRTVYLVVPRGNRKTTLTAAVTLLHAKGPERKPNAQLVSVASDKKQAKGVFKEVASMIDFDYAFMPNIGNTARSVDSARGAKIRDYVSKIMFPGGIEYEALSSDAGTAQGRTPSLVIADEIHAWTKRDPRELWSAMKIGAGKVPNSLTFVTTTAGKGQENLAFDIVDYARKVARGEIDDPSTLAIIYEAPKDADWRDEEVWRTCNPGLPYGYPDIDALRQEAKEAEHKPNEQSAFKRYRLNIWQDFSSDPFIEMAVYDACKATIDLHALRDEPCWLGVDLSAVADLTCIVAAFRDPDVEDGYLVVTFFFCPEAGIERKALDDGAPYPLWAEKGFITPTEGNAVDLRAVEKKIRELAELFQVREVAIDPWGGRDLIARLMEDGLPVIEYRQGRASMSPAIKTLEMAILSSRFKHDGNPCLRWCFENVAVKLDDLGNKLLVKGTNQSKRIDGAIASAMAVARAAAGEGTKRSIYDDEDARPNGFLVW